MLSYMQIVMWNNIHLSQLTMSIKLRIIVVLLVASGTIVRGADNPINWSDCGKTKGCFGNPLDCNSTTTCNSLVTYQLDEANSAITFEMITKLSGDEASNGKWVAVGFNAKSSQMYPAAVTACILWKGDINVALSYNPFHSNTPVDTPAGLITVLASGKEDNYFYCRFRQSLKAAVANSQIPSLDELYYLLLVYGPAESSTTLNQHTPDAHVATKAPTNLTSHQTPAEASSGMPAWLKLNLQKTHGILMIIAWWIAITTAVLFARYFKNIWPNEKWFGNKIWFQFHRALNISGVVLIIIALVCILVQAEFTWRGGADEVKEQQIHSITGLTCIICAFIQPIMALFRCHPGTQHRPIFNIFHRVVGLSGWILASVTIFYATQFTTPGLSAQGDKPLYCMIVFWVITLCVAAALEVHLTLTERLRDSKTYDVVTHNVGNGSADVQPNQPPAPITSRYSSSWSLIRSIFLITSVVTAAGCVATMAYYIGSAIH